MSELLFWQVVGPMLASLVAVFAIVASRNHPRWRESWTLLAALIKVGLVGSLVPGVLAGESHEISLFPIVPGVWFAFRVDPLGLFFALIASFLWLLTSCYSIGYVRDAPERHQTRYFASFALCLSATIGIAFAANLVTFFICYEILSIATYPLVIHKQTREAISAGRRYLAYALTAGLCLFTAIAWLYQTLPSLDFKPGGFVASGGLSPAATTTLFILFLVGCGVKASLIPLHSWLPAAMVAPTPVSALLHAVAVVKAGVFGLLRASGYVFGPAILTASGNGMILAWLAVATLLTGSLLAFRQDNLKRRLAYSTIAHLSYILLGAALFTTAGWRGGLFHLAAHATLKITLFFCAGAIYVKTHREAISELDGIGRTMPVTMGAFTFASLGLVGFPLANGFISKWYLAAGMIEGQRYLFFAALLLASLLCAGYLLPVAYRAFFVAPREKPEQVLARGNILKEVSPWLLVPLVITALASFILGLFPNAGIHLLELATQAANEVLGGV